MPHVKPSPLMTIGTTIAFLLPLPELAPSAFAAPAATLTQQRSLPGGNPGRPPGVPTSGRSLCPGTLKAKQTILIQNKVGQTVSAQPTFLWHLSGDSNLDLEFILTDTAQEEPLFKQRFAQPKAGFTEFKLPPTIKLLPGRQYLWSVRLLCSTTDMAANPTAQGFITYRVAASGLVRQLEAATSATQRAEIYAQQGLWYDALGALWAAYRANPSDTAARQTFFSLLQQMGYETIVQQEQQRNSLNTMSSRSR